MRIKNFSPIKDVIDFFDRFEDKIRAHLSKYPILYTLIGGIAIVLFWRGVWHTADILQERGGWLEWFFYEPNNLIISVIILLSTGLFVSYFIGDTILMSGLKKQKKITDKTEREVEEEEIELKNINSTIKEIKKEVDEIKTKEGVEEKVELSTIKEIKEELAEIKQAIVEEHKIHHGDKSGTGEDK